MNISSSMLIVIMSSVGMQQALANPLSTCMQQQVMTATDSVTVGEMRAYCDSISAEQADVIHSLDVAQHEESAVARRLRLEKENSGKLFSLQPHKPNYLLISNNLSDPNEQPFDQVFPNKEIHLQPWETKFQISLKVPVARDIFGDNGDLFIAYTNRSFWQQFNKDSSSPFRDSNHEPEAWLSFENDSELWGFKNSVIRTGFVHQSNGQGGGLSRSWNRVYADFIIEKGNFYFSFKPWLRISEDTEDDDNSDIDDYLGNFEFSGLYKRGEHTFDFMARNNLDFSDNHGALQLGWSFPITNNVKGYLQWFNGYGESLIDYNAHTNSIGMGIKLSDWL
ncbi:phospholipase [Methylophaga sp. 41_12_T18]|nr:phospholipase [Methylophaga sp. 41_12_T18]